MPPVSEALQRLLSEAAFSGGAQPQWWIEGLSTNFSRRDTLDSYRGEILTEIEADGLAPEAIGKPVLILHGDDDQLAPVAIARYLASVIPDADYAEVPGGSHMLPVTHADRLAAAIVPFVQSGRPAPAADASTVPPADGA